jgi:hypothetical protein
MDPCSMSGITNAWPGQDLAKYTCEAKLAAKAGDIETRTYAIDDDARPLQLPRQFNGKHNIQEFGSAIYLRRSAGSESSSFD